MTAPPFPIPRGMDWDPIKRKFFKKIPAKAKIEPKQLSLVQQIQEEQEKKVAQQPPLRPSPFAGLNSTSLARQAYFDIYTTRRSLPSNSSTQQRKRNVIVSNLSHMQHVSTTSLIPWRYQDMSPAPQYDGKVRIKNLHSSSFLGSMLCFSNGDGEVYYLDTSPIVNLGTSSAFLLKTCFCMPRSTQEVEINSALEADEMSYLTSCSDLMMPCGQSSPHPTVYAFQEEHLAMYNGSKVLVGKAIKTKEPKLLQFSDVVSLNVDPSGDVQLLSLQVLPKREDSLQEEQLYVAFATQRQIGLLQLQHHQSPKVRANLKRMESDIICIEFLPFGKIILAGLRNGTIVRIHTEEFLKRRSTTLKGKAALDKTHANRSSDEHLEALGSGAVTHIKAVSEDEVVVAYTSGAMFLINIPEWKSTVQFQGHVNSWSLDLPMAIDKEHRLLAVAGQDRKVRIWSLDHPLPLYHKQSTKFNEETFDLSYAHLSSKTLQETTFSGPISGLIFCQRRYVANLEATPHSNSSKGLSALAVSCHGNEIAFFE